MGGSSSPRFLVNNKVTSDKKIVAYGFNQFCINTGANLAQSIPSYPRSAITSIKRNLQSMAIMSIKQNDVINIIHNLKVSPGSDSFSAGVFYCSPYKYIESRFQLISLQVPLTLISEFGNLNLG